MSMFNSDDDAGILNIIDVDIVFNAWKKKYKKPIHIYCILELYFCDGVKYKNIGFVHSIYDCNKYIKSGVFHNINGVMYPQYKYEKIKLLI